MKEDEKEKIWWDGASKCSSFRKLPAYADLVHDRAELLREVCRLEGIAFAIAELEAGPDPDSLGRRREQLVREQVKLLIQETYTFVGLFTGMVLHSGVKGVDIE